MLQGGSQDEAGTELSHVAVMARSKQVMREVMAYLLPWVNVVDK